MGKDRYKNQRRHCKRDRPRHRFGKPVYGHTGILFRMVHEPAKGRVRQMGESIQFQGSASGGLEPYSYLWDFGNGDTSEDQNPVYTYDEIGTYDVTFTVTDSAQQVADDQTTATVNEKPCCYEVSIAPGFGLGLKATVTEICDEAHTQDPWRFKIEGGLFVLPISKLNGRSDFAAGETKDIKAALVFGFGNVKISFTISDKCDPTEVDAFMLGPFVNVK